MAVSSHSSHHPPEVLLAQFSLHVHKSGLKPDSFHVYTYFHVRFLYMWYQEYHERHRHSRWHHTRGHALDLEPECPDIADKSEGKEGQTGNEKLDSPHQTYIATYRIRIKSYDIHHHLANTDKNIGHTLLPGKYRSNHVYPGNTSHWHNVVLMLAHLPQHWPKNKTTLGQCLVFAGHSDILLQCWFIARIAMPASDVNSHLDITILIIDNNQW